MNGSLYFHIPFCRRICDYCHFYAIPDSSSLKEQLMEGFRLEWERWLSELGEKEICSIYLGGGTPTLLGPHPVGEILKWIHNKSHDIEITLEANPEDITLELMHAYAQAGVNRISIGIQSLDNQLLRALSRQHSAHTAKEAVMITKDAGITNISVDLMYDLPKQTINSWTKTLEDVVKLPITHLSLYNLVIEPNTVFHKKRNTIQPLQPDEETTLKMFENAVEVLEESGFQQYEVSAFQKEECYSRHNVGYWRARPFLGFGPSAFSFWKGKRFRNVANLGHYYHALKEGLSPVDFEEELPQPSKLRELLAIQFRLIDGVNILEFERRHGPLDDETNATLDRLSGQGLLMRDHDHVALTRKGVLFYDTVASSII